MASRFVSNTLLKCTVTRSSAIAAARCSNPPPVKKNNTNFATINSGAPESLTQVLYSPTSALSRSLNQQKDISMPASDKVARTWEPMEKELWLERFGGPGKRLERVIGNGTVVLRDAGSDGKGYLRVLI